MNPEVLRSMVAPFFEQDPTTPLFVSICCGRMYVGPQKPTQCRTCPTIPSPILLKDPSEIEQVAASLPSS